MIEREKCIDLLNTIANKVCPELRLDFLSHYSNPLVFISHIDITDQVCFHIRELDGNQPAVLLEMFRTRVNDALDRMIAKTKQSKLKETKNETMQ